MGPYGPLWAHMGPAHAVGRAVGRAGGRAGGLADIALSTLHRSLYCKASLAFDIEATVLHNDLLHFLGVTCKS